MPVGAAGLCSVNNSYNEGDDEGEKEDRKG